MGTQPARRRNPGPPTPRRYVMASVKLDVSEHARVAAVSALAGLDRSAWMRRAILDALNGVFIVDRRPSRSAGPASPEAENRPDPPD